MDHEYENDEFYLEKVREFEYYSIKCDHAYLDEAPFEFNSLSYLLYSRFIELLSAPTARAFMKTSKYNYLNTVTRIGIDCFNYDPYLTPLCFEFLRMVDNKVILQEDIEDKYWPDSSVWLPYFNPRYKLRLYGLPLYRPAPFCKNYRYLMFRLYNDEDAESLVDQVALLVHPQLEIVEVCVEWDLDFRGRLQSLFSTQHVISCFTYLKNCEKLKSFKLDYYFHSMDNHDKQSAISAWAQPLETFYPQNAHLETCLLSFTCHWQPNTVTIYGIKDGKFALLSGEPIPDYDMEIQN